MIMKTINSYESGRYSSSIIQDKSNMTGTVHRKALRSSRKFLDKSYSFTKYETASEGTNFKHDPTIDSVDLHSRKKFIHNNVSENKEQLLSQATLNSSQSRTETSYGNYFSGPPFSLFHQAYHSERVHRTPLNSKKNVPVSTSQCRRNKDQSTKYSAILSTLAMFLIFISAHASVLAEGEYLSS